MFFWGTLLLFVAVSASSCKKEELPPPAPVVEAEEPFVPVAIELPYTKTYVFEGNSVPGFITMKSVYWYNAIGLTTDDNYTFTPDSLPRDFNTNHFTVDGIEYPLFERELVWYVNVDAWTLKLWGQLGSIREEVIFDSRCNCSRETEFFLLTIFIEEE